LPFPPFFRYLLLSGATPFGGCGGEPLSDVRGNILGGVVKFQPDETWSGVSSAAKTFIKDLLVTDPSKRPTAGEAQRHEWLKDSEGKANGRKALSQQVS